MTKKNIIIAFITVFLVGGLFYGSWYLYSQKNPSTNSEKEDQEKDNTVIYKNYISEIFNRISFDYPENWNIIEAIDKNGKIIIENTNKSGPFIIEIVREETFGNTVPSWVKIENEEVPKIDSEGNEIILSENFYTEKENTLSLRQETKDSIITYIPYGHTITVIKITGNPKNSTDIIHYHHLISSFRHNVSQHIGM